MPAFDDGLPVAETDASQRATRSVRINDDVLHVVLNVLEQQHIHAVVT